MVDVVTLGETMLRLSPVNVSTLEEAQQFQVDVAGAESNVAVGLARMELKVGWISKLVDNSIGRLIANRIHWHGVDISRIVWADSGRNGLYYLEPGADPRPTRLIYDRADSAFTALTFEEVDKKYVAGAELLHLSGITPALGDSARDLIDRIVDYAKASDTMVSLDVNYRQKLWPPSVAKKILSPIIEKIDVLICSLNDAATVFEQTDKNPEAVVKSLYNKFSNRTVVLTMAAKGALAFDGKKIWQQDAFSAGIVDRIGRGDSFSAGFLYGYLRKDIAAALKFGNAMAALNQTLKGDFFWCSKDDVTRMVAGHTQNLDR